MAELITNGDFADGDTGWTLTGSAAVITTEDLRFPDEAGTAEGDGGGQDRVHNGPRQKDPGKDARLNR